MRRENGKCFLKVVSLFLCVILTFMGCKKNVGTPEDNATVTETEAPEEMKDYSFGVSLVDNDLPYYDTLLAAIREEIVDNKGYRLNSKNPKGDAELQETQIQEMIDQGIQVIFLAPVDAEKIGTSLEALKDANVKIINVDTQVKNLDDVDAFVGTDNHAAGVLCGNALVSKFLDGGHIAILENTSVNSICERFKGMEETIAMQPFEVVTREEAKLDGSDAGHIVTEILKKYPNTDMIICGTDTMVKGAILAVRDSKNTKVTLAGFDGSPEIKKEIQKSDSKVSFDIGQSPLEIGKKAAGTAIAMLDGEDYEQEIYVDAFVISISNLSLYGTDGWQ